MFKSVEDRPDFPQLEKQILDFWQRHDVFHKLVDKNKDNERWSFFDGPITANNPMGVHHAWGRTYKDIFIRYKAMQGFHQRYQNGFDCQGLWVEVEVEKELGLNSKRDILDYGLENFSCKCRERVEKYSQIQTQQSVRLGQWMHWDNSYYTMSDTNIECIWQFLQQCYNNGWLYLGQRSMPWCIRCGTSLSHHELYDSYKDMSHKSVTMALPLVEKPGEYIMVWTTTPWTLSANTALAVHPQLEYTKVREDDKILYVSSAVLERMKIKGQVVGKVKGQELIGMHYHGPMEIPAREGLDLRIIPWDAVGAEEGTGVVHIAPGCGAEDYELSKQENLAVIVPIDESGYYVDKAFGPLYQKRVDEVAELVFAHLQQHGYLYNTEEYAHRYPVCWRCREELVFRVVDEWFIRCDQIRERMKKAAATVTWMPEYAGHRMQNWLDNMGDWCISRRRFWGLPLPFYRCSCGEMTVIGSCAELRERAATGIKQLKELHRPWIDKVKIKCPKCGKRVSRVEEVGDCWLDAGIISFSTLDYLHNREYWQQWYPCEFITEMIEQVRLWFYSLLFMSVTLEDDAPYKRVLTFSAVVDTEGSPFSKTLGNAIPFDEAADKMGADIMRWMFAGQNVRNALRFGYEPGRDIYRKMLTLWNVYKFFITYANLDRPDLRLDAGKDLHSDMDRWLLARLNQYLQLMHQNMENYDSANVVKLSEAFWEDLSNWYLRRSRRRFWKSENDQDKAAAYATLYHTLRSVSLAVAPVLPFFSEYIYQNLVAAVDDTAPLSVHLNDYPCADSKQIDEQLLENMESVMRICGLGHAVRDLAKIKVRQPLSRLLIFDETDTGKQGAKRFMDIIVDELNVKNVEFIDKQQAQELYNYQLQPNLQLLGPKYGKQLKDIKQALAKADAKEVAKAVAAGHHVNLALKKSQLALAPEEILVKKQGAQGFSVIEDKGLLVALDIEITPDLKLEGVSRDLVRMIQKLRKDADFHVADRIDITYQTNSDLLVDAIKKFRSYIRQETLAESLRKGASAASSAQQTVKIGKEEITLALYKHDSQ